MSFYAPGLTRRVLRKATRRAERYAALRRGKPRPRFSLCPRFKLPASGPFYARPGHPQFQARSFTSFPDSRHESCGDNFRAGPYAPRRVRRANGVVTPGCLLYARLNPEAPSSVWRERVDAASTLVCADVAVFCRGFLALLGFPA